MQPSTSKTRLEPKSGAGIPGSTQWGYRPYNPCTGGNEVPLSDLSENNRDMLERDRRKRDNRVKEHWFHNNIWDIPFLNFLETEKQRISFFLLDKLE